MPDEGTQTETTQETTQTAAPTSVVNADGSFADNWSDKYGEDSKATLLRFNNFDDLVNSHISLRSKYGKNPDAMVEVPTETSSDEVKTAFNKARGTPESFDKYEYALSDEMAIKLGPIEDDRMNKFKEFAHNKLHLNQGEFKEALDFYHNMLSDDIGTADADFTKQQTEDAVTAKAELRKNPGYQSEEEYAAKVQIAQSVMEKYDLVEIIAEANLQNSAKLIERLNRIADSMSEDTLKGLKGSTVISAANIDTQITELRGHQSKIRKENPVNFKSDPAFKDLEGRLKELYQKRPA